MIFLCWKKNTRPRTAANGRATMGNSGIELNNIKSKELLYDGNRKIT
ncbi:MAG: hypothetical protein L6282_08085 [Candidatus Methanoperedenaceae archaeon]|nr:hypothetical protein [Candidatus Methanoperedenaceae archaeon]